MHREFELRDSRAKKWNIAGVWGSGGAARLGVPRRTGAAVGQTERVDGSVRTRGIGTTGERARGWQDGGWARSAEVGGGMARRTIGSGAGGKRGRKGDRTGGKNR